MISVIPKMGINVRKPVFGIYDQARPKPACSGTETSQKNWNLACSKFRYYFFQLENIKDADQTVQMRRLCRCADWSAPLLLANPEDKFSRIDAQLNMDIHGCKFKITQIMKIGNLSLKIYSIPTKQCAFCLEKKMFEIFQHSTRVIQTSIFFILRASFSLWHILSAFLL